MSQDLNEMISHYTPEKWMSYIPDSIRINQIRIPGTHDSGSGSNTSKKLFAGAISKVSNFAACCHTLDLLSQLKRGIRYLDIRLKLEPDKKLNIYHKIVRYEVTFSDLLKLISDFFDENQEECIMLRVHREDGDPGGKFHRDEVSDKMFVDAIVRDLNEFEERERTKRLAERRNQIRINADNNNFSENINTSNVNKNTSNSNENASNTNENASNTNENASNSNENAYNDNNPNDSIFDNSGNSEDYLKAVYDNENDNPTLGEVRRKIILFGILHVVDFDYLRERTQFKFRTINKQSVYKLKCKERDIERKKKAIIEGFERSKSAEFDDLLFVNEINATGSIRGLSFIPCPKKMAEIMNNIMESILIQLFKDRKALSNSNDNENNQIQSDAQHENIQNDFQGVLLFDFPEISKAGKLIELVYIQNFI